ncbi:MAG: DUF3293 domain-containing protein [Verrucomicrobiota bacterium]
MKDEYQQVRFHCEQKELPAAFFVVTAHNPEGNTVDDIANQMANEQLRAELESLNFKNFHVTGGNSDFSHAEPGYGIVCTREEALRLARKFRQDAIFEVREGKVFLVSAKDPTELIKKIGLWVELMEQPEST